MIKITHIKKTSPWYDDRDNFIDQIFRVDGSRYYPESPKAKNFAVGQGIEYFVFIDGALTLPV